jgi:phosphate-selective porin
VFAPRLAFRHRTVAGLAGLAAMLAARPVLAQAGRTASTEAESRHWTAGWNPRPSVRFGEAFLLEARGRFQVDSRETDTAFVPGEDTWKTPLKRIGVRGTVGRSVSFQVDRELVRVDPWRDAFVNWRVTRAFEVRAGQFKLPFSLDENTPLTTLDFIYRSRAARQLAPGRDPGVMAHGQLRGGIRYEAGWFSKDGKNARRVAPTRVQAGDTFAARLRAQPFRSTPAVALRDLEAGVAVTTGRLPEGLDAIRARTALDLPFFSSDIPVAGRRRRVGLELLWQPGPFSIRSEYIRLSDARDGTSNEGRAAPSLIGRGWYVSGSWILTGGRKADGLVPARNLFHGGAGTIELAARIERLGFSSARSDATAVEANHETAATVGATWVANQWLRAQVNVIRERLDDPAQGPSPGVPVIWSQVFRFQFTF